MVGTIIPVGYGDRRNVSMFKVMGVHCIGYLVGAATLGALSGALGGLGRALSFSSFPRGVILIVVGFGMLLLGGRELRLCPIPYPQSQWQVPVRWRNRFGPLSMAFAYALVLGFGLATRFPAIGLIVVTWAALNGDVLVAIVVLCGFGLGRAIPLLATWMMRTVLKVDTVFAVVSGSTALVKVANGLLLSAAGGLLLGVGGALR